MGYAIYHNPKVVRLYRRLWQTDDMNALKTPRLKLSPLAAEHIADVHQMSIDPEVRRYLWEGQIIPLSQVEDMVRASTRCFAELGSGFYVMHIDLDGNENDGAFVGFCGHRFFERAAEEANKREVELLFGMTPKFWGRGYGQEAAIAVLDHGFNQCGFERVVAATDTPNQRSVQVLQKLGMSFTERRAWRGLDTVFYALSAEEFRNQG